MGHYVRVLTPKSECISAAVLRSALAAAPELPIHFEGGDDDWASCDVGQRARPVLQVTRERVAPGSMGEAELEEFQHDLKRALPSSGAAWLREYLKRVQTIYAVQLVASHPSAAGAVIEALRAAAGGIVQADREGFSNEDGHCIVWQFSEQATGPWTMAVLDAHGAWTNFTMELSNHEQRAAFKRGEVPRSIQRS